MKNKLSTLAALALAGALCSTGPALAQVAGGTTTVATPTDTTTKK